MAETRTLVGISSLDEQHEALGGMLNAFQLAISARRPAEEIRAIIETGCAAVRAHFQHEEALMVRSGYAGTAAHRFEHERMLLAVTSLTEDALEQRHAPEVLADNGDVLRELFTSHIAQDDRALAAYLLSLETA